jgi:predicted AAA+ superfamily ATPase
MITKQRVVLYTRSMKRVASERLSEWLKQPSRRPLLVRGARQVGKTWLVRTLARSARRELVELNFERDPNAIRWFTPNDPRQILDELSLGLDRKIEPERALLFLDEIQAAPLLLPKLRWFGEELAELPVIAA